MSIAFIYAIVGTYLSGIQQEHSLAIIWTRLFVSYIHAL